ncbi:MAG: multidrug efflux SMR transporter [Xanthomonadales bacterium]|nr:multidrug efflux SMR transporter [Xanthomonadales bacterium]
MAWFLLVAAGLLEIGWAVGLRCSEGFTRPWPTVGTLVAMAASFALLGLALRTLPLGTAYAAWTGIGIAGTAAFGMLVLGESVSVLRVASLALILIGVAGLKLAAGST